ncbi:hypothetical protein V6Z11_A04G066400 [Gossypium hirsutum]
MCNKLLDSCLRHLMEVKEQSPVMLEFSIIVYFVEFYIVLMLSMEMI